MPRVRTHAHDLHEHAYRHARTCAWIHVCTRIIHPYDVHEYTHSRTPTHAHPRRHAYTQWCSAHAYNVRCTVYSVHCTLYTIQYIMYNVHWSLYSAVYIVHCTLYSVQCTVYIVVSVPYRWSLSRRYHVTILRESFPSKLLLTSVASHLRWCLD